MRATTNSDSLERAFRAALLLTGDIDSAEKAVLNGIAGLKPGDDLHRSLVVKTVVCILRQPAYSSQLEHALTRLPSELRQLIALAPVPRNCFLLRSLLGIHPVDCAAILNLTMQEFEQSLSDAFEQLPSGRILTCSP